MPSNSHAGAIVVHPVRKLTTPSRFRCQSRLLSASRWSAISRRGKTRWLWLAHIVIFVPSDVGDCCLAYQHLVNIADASWSTANETAPTLIPVFVSPIAAFWRRRRSKPISLPSTFDPHCVAKSPSAAFGSESCDDPASSTLST